MNVKRCQLKYLPYILIFLFTLIVVLYRFALGRSLWLDEAALANNLLLDNTILNNTIYLQSAPPIFKFISLISVKLLGVNEYALRFFPMLCFLFSCLLFYLLIDKIIKNDIVKMCTFLSFSINPLLLYYALEFKQYSCDLMISLLFIVFCYYLNFNRMSLKNFSVFCFLYSLSIWLSHFSLFLFVPFLVFFVSCFRFSEFKRKIFIFVLLFLISFIPFYFLHLRFICSNSALHQYWHASFITSFPSALVLLNNFFANAIPLINYLLISLLLVFSILFFENNTKKIFLILFFISPFLASFFSLYPFNPRLFLPIVPLVLIFLFSLSNYKKIFNYFLFLLFLPYFVFCFLNLFNENLLYREEMRPLLSYLSQNINKGDYIYLKRGAHQAFRFYTKNYYKPYYFSNEVIYEQNCPNGSEFCNLNKGMAWIVCVQNSNNLPNSVKLLKKANFFGSSLYYVKLE